MNSNLERSTNLKQKFSLAYKGSPKLHSILNYFVNNWYKLQIKNSNEAKCFLRVFNLLVEEYPLHDLTEDSNLFLIPYIKFFINKWEEKVKFEAYSIKKDYEFFQDDTISNKKLLQIYERSRCSESHILRRDNLSTQICQFIEAFMPPFTEAHEYGAGKNSFGMDTSDIDISVDNENIKPDSKDVLLHLKQIFLKWKHTESLIASDTIFSKRSLLCLKFRNNTLDNDMKVQISINNLIPQINTEFVFNMAQLDSRIHQLCFLIKFWAKQRNISDSSNGYISSYFWILITYFFLMTLDDPITINHFLPPFQFLPQLEERYPSSTTTRFWAWKKERDEIKYNQINMNYFKNNDSVFILLGKFFKFFAITFDRFHNAISFRHQPEKGFIKKSKLLKLCSQDYKHSFLLHLIIEDPFRPGTIHLSSNINRERKIWYEFQRAHRLFQDHAPIETIFSS